MWKPSTMLIAALLVVDSFFICYAIGLNSRRVAVVDNSLPPIIVPTATTSKSE